MTTTDELNANSAELGAEMQLVAFPVAILFVQLRTALTQKDLRTAYVIINVKCCRAFPQTSALKKGGVDESRTPDQNSRPISTMNFVYNKHKKSPTTLT